MRKAWVISIGDFMYLAENLSTGSQYYTVSVLEALHFDSYQEAQAYLPKMKAKKKITIKQISMY